MRHAHSARTRCTLHEPPTPLPPARRFPPSLSHLPFPTFPFPTSRHHTASSQVAAPQLFGATLERCVLQHCAPPRTIVQGTSLSEALQLLSERQLRALPVVDSSGALVDVISARDVRHLASHSQTDDLTTRVEDSLRSLPPHPDRLHTCTPADTLGSAIQRLANADVGQLVCVDSNGAVCGVIASADILTCFLEPPAAAQQQQVAVQ